MCALWLYLKMKMRGEANMFDLMAALDNSECLHQYAVYVCSVFELYSLVCPDCIQYMCVFCSLNLFEMQCMQISLDYAHGKNFLLLLTYCQSNLSSLFCHIVLFSTARWKAWSCRKHWQTAKRMVTPHSPAVSLRQQRRHHLHVSSRKGQGPEPVQQPSTKSGQSDCLVCSSSALFCLLSTLCLPLPLFHSPRN